MTDIVPALPPGFTLDGGDVPALPPGFVLDAGPVKNADGTYGEPPAGEVIHGANQDYISDQPQISATRLSDTDERQNAITSAVLKGRADAVADGGTDLFPEWQRRAMPLTQGFSFNSADELISHIVAGMKNPDAVMNSAITMPDKDDPSRQRYEADADVTQEIQRQMLDRNRDERPIENIAGNVAGGLSSGIGLAKNGVTILGNIANRGLSNLIPRMGAGALEGGVFGSLAGYYGADGDSETRTQEAVDNLPLSMMVGAGAVPIVDAVSAVLGPLVNTFRDPVTSAMSKLSSRMAADDTTPDVLAAKVKAAIDEGQTDYRMVDAAGKNTQRLGALAAKAPGEFRNTVDQTMSARQMNQGERIGGYVDDTLGTGGDAFKTKNQLLAGRQTKAEPLYEEAYKLPVPDDPALGEMLARPSVKDAITSAQRVAAENQRPVTELFTETVDANGEKVTLPTMRGWDYIKKELDAKVNQLYNSGDKTAATATKDTRNQLREILKQNPKYGEALATYSDDSASLDAIDAGKSMIAARNADEAKAALEQVSPGDKELAKLGASREVGVKLENMRGGQDKTLLFDTPAMMDKITTLADDPVATAVMKSRLGREKDMVKSSRTMLGGSTTYENSLDDAVATNEGGAMAALLNNQWLRAAGLAAGSAMGKMGRRAQGISEEGAQAIGDFLMSADPEKIKSLAAMYAQALERETAPSTMPSILNATFNAPRGGGN